MMKTNTKIIKIEPDNMNIKLLQEAGLAIRQGKLVAFPTETVYGLGADALNDNAVAKIFEAKGRPFYDPLIVHVACLKEVFDLVEEFPEIASTLGAIFWPGPLTMVMRKSKKISHLVTSGLDTVAIRIPDHSVAQALIRESGRPIAAPSANLFSYTSPTKAKHVISDLNGRVDIILDSGDTKVGVESTVVDVTGFPLKILRLGGVPFEKLKEVTPDIIIHHKNAAVKTSPGMLKKHYSPKAKMILVEDESEKMVNKIIYLASGYRNKGKKVGIITSQENAGCYKDFLVSILGKAHDLESCAHQLYSQLRSLDEMQCEIIISENFEDKGLGRAIMDRLRRASSDQ